MKEIPLLSLLYLTLLLSCTGYGARLIVRPNSSHFTEGDDVTLICEEDQSFSDWTVRRNTSKLQRTECGDGWGQRTGQLCLISVLVPHDTGVYWCESSNGVISNLVNITVTGPKTITAESGQDVTLTSRAPNNKIMVVKWSRADLGDKYVLLYRDEKFDPEGQHSYFKNRVDLQDRQMKDGNVSLILKDVTVNDAGTYQCLVFLEETRKLQSFTNIYLHVDPPGPTRGFRDRGLIVSLSVCTALVAAALIGFLIYYNRT